MTAFNKILFALYYLVWAIFLCLLYAYFTEKLYIYFAIFWRIAGLLAIGVAVLTLLTLAAFYLFKPANRRFYKQLTWLVLLPMAGLIPFFIIKALPGKLESTVHKIKVSGVNYACECADWRIVEIDGKAIDWEKGEDIFIEPVNDWLQNEGTRMGNVMLLTGRFYKRKGFPRNFHSEQMPEKARVFQYTSFGLMQGIRAVEQ